MSLIDRTESLFAACMRIRQFARYSVGAFFGSIAATSSRYKFMMDLLERSHFERMELRALVGLLIKKGLIAEGEWEKALDEEAKLYEGELKERWPEVTPADDGLSYELGARGFSDRCFKEGWPP